MQDNESKKPTQKRTRKPRTTKSKGLGDTVEKITKATGIKKAVEVFSKATGIDCGCAERQELLNKIFPYQRHRPSNCMTESSHKLWTQVKDITKAEKQAYIKTVYPVIAKIHAHLFNHKYHEPCTCSPAQWDNWRKDIENVYSTYEKDILQPTEK